jgi:hypothetical protein
MFDRMLVPIPAPIDDAVWVELLSQAEKVEDLRTHSSVVTIWQADMIVVPAVAGGASYERAGRRRAPCSFGPTQTASDRFRHHSASPVDSEHFPFEDRVGLDQRRDALQEGMTERLPADHEALALGIREPEAAATEHLAEHPGRFLVDFIGAELIN